MTISFEDFDPAQHLTPAQLVERWKHTPFPRSLGTLARWRRAGREPKFIKAGHSDQRVYYPLTAVESYEATLIHPPTA